MTITLQEFAQAAGVTQEVLTSALVDAALTELIDHVGNLAYIENAKAARANANATPEELVPTRDHRPEHLRETLAELIPSLVLNPL